MRLVVVAGQHQATGTQHGKRGSQGHGPLTPGWTSSARPPLCLTAVCRSHPALAASCQGLGMLPQEIPPCSLASVLSPGRHRWALQSGCGRAAMVLKHAAVLQCFVEPKERHCYACSSRKPR